MILETIKEVDINRRELEISSNPEEFEKGIELAYKKIGKRYHIPGFRKGKAPKNFIEKKYGKSIFYEEAVNIICPELIDAAVAKADLDVVKDKIDFNLKSINDSGFTFTVTLTVKPVAKISGYKGIKIEPFTKKITADDLENRLLEIRKDWAKLVPVTGRPCKNDDTVVIDFEGTLNGKAFTGNAAKNYSLKLGSHQTIEGFEEGIVGHKAGDEFNITATFPDNYGVKDLAKKNCVFKIKLNEIKEPKLPDLTDEFVKEISKKETVTDFKASVKEQLEKELLAEKEENTNMQIINKLISLLDVEIPESMYKNREHDNLVQLRDDFSHNRISLEDALAYTKTSEDTKKTMCRELAEQQVKLSLALEAVVKNENISPSEEEIEKKYTELAKMCKKNVSEIKKTISKKAMIHDLACLKAFDFLKKSAIIKEH